MAWRAALIFIKGCIHLKAMREGFTAVSGTWAGVGISGVGCILRSRRCRYTGFSAGKWLHNSEAMKGILEKRATGTTKTFWGFASPRAKALMSAGSKACGVESSGTPCCALMPGRPPVHKDKVEKWPLTGLRRGFWGKWAQKADSSLDGCCTQEESGVSKRVYWLRGSRQAGIWQQRCSALFTGGQAAN